MNKYPGDTYRSIEQDGDDDTGLGHIPYSINASSKHAEGKTDIISTILNSQIINMDSSRQPEQDMATDRKPHSFQQSEPSNASIVVGSKMGQSFKI
jgi:hypothetical protein